MNTKYKLVPMEPTPEMIKAGSDMYWQRIEEVDGIWDAMLAVAPEVEQEPVGWQFYQDGKWWYGDDRIKVHRKNTEQAGIPTRDLYAVPQPAPDVTGLVDALEDINQWVSRWASADHPVAKAARKALAAYHKGVKT